MHTIMILAALAVAWQVRQSWFPASGNWRQRWGRTLWFFLFPPLLLAIAGISVLFMGTQGTMLGLSVGRFSYGLTVIGFVVAIGLGIKLAWQGWRAVRHTRSYPQGQVEGVSCRILETPILFSALVGFWRPELVVSQGLLYVLTPEQLAAAIAHEQAHYYYRDTFWFFWLGWIRTCTGWLPQTEALWEELLLLRELRADNRAAQTVDPLTLAESLLLVVRSAIVPMTNFCVAFSAASQTERLNERIDALLEPSALEPSAPSNQPRFNLSWLWLLLALLPLVTVPFHS
jgi:Zn-dependent protease with chaperone function